MCTIELEQGKTALPEIHDLTIKLGGDFAGDLGKGVAFEPRPTQHSPNAATRNFSADAIKAFDVNGIVFFCKG
jgi:hypothetical protein